MRVIPGCETKNPMFLFLVGQYVAVHIVGEDQIVVEDAETFDEVRDDWRFSSPHQMGI